MLYSDKVIISIVTHNSQDIFRVLENLKCELAADSTFKVTIFDNNSSEEYKNKLREYSDFADIIFHPKNGGFGYGHNANLLKSQHRYGIIFNPDVLVTRQAMVDMLELLQSKPEVAVVSPKVLNPDGSPQYLVRSDLDLFDYFLRFIPSKRMKKRFDARLARFECRNLPEDQASYIRMGSGCFMVFDLEKYRSVQGFDERFFMYFEDNDLCLRLEKQNYKILYTPFSSVTHLYGKGAHYSARLFLVFINSMIRFFNKWGWRIM